MLKKTITYTDYDGNERTEDFYFNFSKGELMEMNLATPGGMRSMIERIAKERDSQKLVSLFKDMITKSYGVKSPDGKRFIKSQELTDAFLQTEAYSDLFVELANNQEAAAAFITGIFPTIPEAAMAEAKAQAAAMGLPTGE